MTLILLLFLAALSLEGIGTYISVIGLAATFAADPIILTMAVVLDFCKIISVNTLAKSWPRLTKTVRTYLVASTLVLSIITSAGVAGYLSNSFQKAMLPTQGNDIALVSLKSEQERLLARKKEIDTQISQLPPNQVRSRQRLMTSFKPETDHINTRLIAIEAELPKLQTTKVQAHTEVGAIMYLAEIAGITPGQAVGIIIVMIIFVFDPMAIVFLITANTLLRFRKEEKEEKKPEPIVIDEKDVIDQPIVDEVLDPEVVDEPEPEPAPSILEKLPEVEDQATIIYPVKRLPNITIDMTQVPKSTLAIVEPVAEKINAEVVVEEPAIEEPPIIVPEYVPVVEEEDTTPYPFPLVAPTEERPTERYEEEVHESTEKLAKALDGEPLVLTSPFEGMDQPWTEEKIAELDAALAPYETEPEPTFTTDVEVLHIGEPTPMPLEEGMELLKQALDPIRNELAAKEEEPHLEEVLREILADKEGPLTDEERIRLDRALDRIFANDPQREHSDEPEDEEAEDHQPVAENVPDAVPTEPEVQYAPSTLDNPNLDSVKGSGVQYVGPVFVNPTVLETYAAKS